MSTVPRYTTRDLEAFPDPLDDTRYEIVDGDLYVAKQPSWHHQRVCGRVWSVLDIWSDQTGAGEAVLAPGLIFSPEDNVAPDVVWISRARLELSFFERYSGPGREARSNSLAAALRIFDRWPQWKYH